MITTTAVVAGAVVLLGCGVTVFTVVHQNMGHRKLNTDDASIIWTYGEGADEGFLDPEHWGDEFPDCYGTHQSPINLADAHIMRATPDRYNLEFFDGACHSTSLSFFPGEHQWMVNLEACPDAPKLSFVNETYVLINVHIHSVSEHSMGTASHDAEVHMVHVKEGTDDELLVVGVLLDENTHGENDNIHDLWDVMVTGQEMANSSFFFSAYEMLPQSPAYSHYMGSLTTPPCTESVVWIVMSMSTVVGHSQLTTFREAMGSAHLVSLEGNTNRPVQPLNTRHVTYVF